MLGDILDHQKEQSFSNEIRENRGQEVAESGYSASKDVESACSGDDSNGEILIEEADGSSSGEKSTTLLSLFLEVFGLEVEERLSTMATQYWAEAVWIGKWYHEQREGWMKQV